MKVWDYQIPKNWAPKTDDAWEWFLVRKINYGDFTGLKKEIVKKFFPRIKRFLDPGKRRMFAYFLKQ